jgi:selenocysteine lyase/cysteine desulfurase
MLTPSLRERDFPSLQEMTYLNTAAEGIPPRAVLEALQQYGDDKLLGFEGRALHEAQWDAAKERLAAFYGLSPDEVGICSSSSEAYNLAALALRLKAGDEVIVSDLDFPAGATPWLLPERAATVKVWRSRAGALHIDDLIPLLNARTRFLNVSLVSFLNGFKLPLRETIEAVRKYSPALIGVDVTQALGRIPIDLCDVDLIISSTHKWLLASHGGGLVGIPKSCADDVTVPAGGWFNMRDPFGADRFDRPVTNLPGAAGFTVGMPNYAAVYCIAAALEYIAGVGVEAIDESTQPLMEACMNGLRKLPVEIITPDDPASWAGILAFRHDDADRIAAALREKNVHIMSHAGRLRVSIHGYNTMQDIEVLLRGLHDACV